MKTLILKKYMNIIVLVFFLTWTLTALGIEPVDGNEITNVLSHCMNKVRQGQTDWSAFEFIEEKYGTTLFPYLEDYFEDSNENVRWHSYHSYASIAYVGIDANDVFSRRRIVYKLLTRLRDDESVKNKQYLGSRLLQFTTANDFNNDANGVLSQLLSKILSGERLYSQRDIVLLIGVADMKSELPRLQELMENIEEKLKKDHENEIESLRSRIGKRKDPLGIFDRRLKKQYWQNTLFWHALRARARMGVEEDISRCIELVQLHPDEDYRVSFLLKELAYIRQPEVVDYLYTYLKSDKLGRYGGHDVIRRSYAQRSAMALATMLRDFPGSKSYGGNPERIERCRLWMSEQAKWDIIR